MGCCNGRNIQIKCKTIEKNTADEAHISKSESEEKWDIDNDTWKDDISLVLEENDFVKAFKTQENHLDTIGKDLTLLTDNAAYKLKRWNSIKTNHLNDSKRESECKRFLIQELNLDKIKEEIEDQDEKQKNTNTSPLFKANKPIKNIKLKGLFNKEDNQVLPASLSTPRDKVVDKPVEARLTGLESLPMINMINVDKFYTQELDKIIEIDQED